MLFNFDQFRCPPAAFLGIEKPLQYLRLQHCDWPTIPEYNHAFQSLQHDFNQLNKIEFIEQQRVSSRKMRAFRKERQMRGSKSYHDYNTQVFASGKVPTRPRDWHDFFNFLIWIILPRTKFALHEISFRTGQQFHSTVFNNRSKMNDLLTKFDEGGLIAFVSQEYFRDLVDAVSSRDDERKLAAVHRSGARFLVFGHGLYDCLRNGQSQIHAMTVVLPCANNVYRPTPNTALDQTVEQYIRHENWTASVGSFHVQSLIELGVL